MRDVRFSVAGIAAIFLVWSTQAMAFDGSKPLACALIELYSCESGSACQIETPASVNIPRFLFVDAKQGEVTGTRPDGELLSTMIERQRTQDDLLVLEGVQNDLSWTVTISQSTGRMSLGAIGDNVGFTAFGECVGASPN